MRLAVPSFAASLLAASQASHWTPGNTAGTDRLARNAVQNIEAQHYARHACNPSNTYVRKEWLSLRPSEKKAYISAVKCLQSKPAISSALAPGAKSRFDDFVGTHINQTLTIHGTVSLLPAPST